MSHHVPGPPDYDVIMTEQVPGLNGPKMLGRHKPTAPYRLLCNRWLFDPMTHEIYVQVNSRNTSWAADSILMSRGLEL